jgi:uncharacterized protein YjbI with pentapeptide repeats
MADEEHLEILDQGTEAWNRWRKQNPEIRPNLSRANLINRDLSRIDFSNCDLSRADLSKAELSHANLHGANLESSTLILADLLGAILNECDLSGASLFGAFLFGTRLKGADLSGSNLMGTSLMGADLAAADLSGAHLMGTNFHDASLEKANLRNANLTAASLVGAKIGGSVLENCTVYGVSAFNLEGIPETQSNLKITPLGESPIAVSDLESAQFAYLLISGERVPQLLESVHSRLVLVLGDFRAEREAVLKSIETVLQHQEFTSITAHFNPPVHRDLTLKTLLLAKYVRFIVADVTGSRALLRFLRDSWKDAVPVPVQPLVQSVWSESQISNSISEPLTYSDPEDVARLLQKKLAALDSNQD